MGIHACGKALEKVYIYEQSTCPENNDNSGKSNGTVHNQIKNKVHTTHANVIHLKVEWLLSARGAE